MSTTENGPQVDVLKLNKTKFKTAFTKMRHKLLKLLDDDLPSRREVREMQSKLDDSQDAANEVMVNLADIYFNINDAVNTRKITSELEKLEDEYTTTNNRAQEYLDSRADEASSVTTTLSRQQKVISNDRVEDNCRTFLEGIDENYIERDDENKTDYKSWFNQNENYLYNIDNGFQIQHDVMNDGYQNQNGGNEYHEDQSQEEKLKAKRSDNSNLVRENYFSSVGKDLWKQLKRVSIPTFSGNKSTFENWKSAFVACVDNAPASPEYKLLQLRQCLSGEALKSIENLGHSAEALFAAKSRLERKFGGKRRQIALYLEEIENFKVIRQNNAKDVDKFADLIDIIVINLKDAGKHDELCNGSFYVKLQQKLPTSMLANYHRWIHEKQRKESVHTLREWVIREAEFFTIANETANGVGTEKDTKQDNRNFYGKQDKSTKRRSCKACEGAHGIWSCEVFKKMTIPRRWELIKDLKLCFCCLGDDHMSKVCSRKRRCGINQCDMKHNRLLHSDTDGKSKVGERSTGINAETNHDSLLHSDVKGSSNVGERSNVSRTSEYDKPRGTTYTAVEVKNLSLRTVPVILRNGNKRLIVNALLDDGSNKTYVNSDVAAQLGVSGEAQQIEVNVLNGQIESFETMNIELMLESLDGKTVIPIAANSTENVTGKLKAINWNNYKHKWNHLKHIEFPQPACKSIIDILIGLDYSDVHHSLLDVPGKIGEPIARKTPLGWTCIGCLDNTSIQSTARTHFIGKESIKLDETLRRFWEIEAEGLNYESNMMSVDDEKALKQTKDTVKIINDRYEVSIPWKDSQPCGRSNYNMALRRLCSTERKLKGNTIAASSYCKIIDDYVEKNYIRKISDNEKNQSNQWYLHHFAVLRPDKETTKTRIVFDASAKVEGISLNDLVHQGPKLQRDLFAVLLRFRRNAVAIVSDISEMYLQVMVKENDRKFLRFIWRDMEPERDPDHYEFNRVVVGMSCSPFLAQYVVRSHAEKKKADLPLAAETALESTYMDDSMDSVADDNTGKELYNQLCLLWKGTGMHARKWLSNSTSVIMHIPIKDRAKMIDIKDDKLPTIKTLGLLWEATTDTFSFTSVTIDTEFKFTKRNFLKKIAAVFDTLGFLSPFIIKAKILIQLAWQSGVDWDEIMPDEINKDSKDWFQQLELLETIKIDRCILLKQHEKEVNISLHAFCDASELAYGTAIYATTSYDNGKTISKLIASKTRVAPLISTSIPRLELMAAVLCINLVNSIAYVYKVSSDKITYWTDSMDVLHWIHSASRRYKPFVANRVEEIHSKSSPENWRYVPTDLNPADLTTRGISIQKLAKSKSWWYGPVYINESIDKWPAKKITTTKNLKEEKKSDIFAVTHFQSQNESSLDAVSRLNPEKYSSWLKFKRIYAWVIRFIHNCKCQKSSRELGELKASEVSNVEINIIKDDQKRYFDSEHRALVKEQTVSNKSKLFCLQPIIGENGLIRCNGRIRNAIYLPYDMRFPIILPRESWVTKLIVRQAHEDDFHYSGTNHILSKLSTKYWILSAREVIREIERACVSCRKRKGKPLNQVMAPLPNFRIQANLNAFHYSAVDYGGPFYTIQGRGKKRLKRYLCLFTCLNTRAVHLELAYNLDTDSFLNAFYRMVNRRGTPVKIYSDNGSNFVGADRELKELVAKLSKDKIIQDTGSKGIEWEFNPPLTPHFGGAHEIMIKAAKRAINCILNNADINDEELHSAITGAEFLVNSRPLTYQSSNSSDLTPLTPNHFLMLHTSKQFAAESVDNTSFNIHKRWRRVQELVRHFWHRWLKEWLPSLQSTRKWNKEANNIKIGDVVLVIKPDEKRGEWPIGRVEKTYQGDDGKVRVIDVIVKRKVYKRSIKNIILLQKDDNQ